MPTLDWIGKKAVVNHHRQVPYHLLRCDNSLSCGDTDSGNLLVEGDNLLALKALLPYYAGQVKCIYIDPPYNTGNENWVYNDNVNSPEMKKWLGKVVGKEGEDLTRSDKWLCMMYPRLNLLKQFLRKDGAIFVNINDGEVAPLRLILDEIFGRRNFIASIVWQKKQSPQNDAINLSDMHDYILVYAKQAKENRGDLKGWNRNLLPRTEKQDRRYKNPDNDPKGAWTSVDYTCNKNCEERPNLYYAIINPNTGREIWPSKNRVWRFDQTTHKKNVEEGRVWWGASGKNFPRFKRYLNEVSKGIVPTTWWTREDAGDNQESRREFRTIFSAEEADFQTPKPKRLIQRILQIATDEDSIVLDSFAGSGTTGHAVLNMNKQDNGNRRFVLVEMIPDICNKITRKRLKAAIEGYTYNQTTVEGLGSGFRYCKLDKPLFDETGNIGRDVKFSDVAAHVFFTESGNPIPKRPNKKNPFLGISMGTGYYLLFNGVLGDRSPDGGNVLTSKVLAMLPAHEGPKVIFGEGCRLSSGRLKRERITFKQLPYEVRVS